MKKMLDLISLYGGKKKDYCFKVLGLKAKLKFYHSFFNRSACIFAKLRASSGKGIHLMPIKPLLKI